MFSEVMRKNELNLNRVKSLFLFPKARHCLKLQGWIHENQEKFEGIVLIKRLQKKKYQMNLLQAEEQVYERART